MDIPLRLWDLKNNRAPGKSVVAQKINPRQMVQNRYFSGYEQLWSEHNFTCFDAIDTECADDHAAIAEFLKTIYGKQVADSYDFRNSRGK